MGGRLSLGDTRGSDCQPAPTARRSGAPERSSFTYRRRSGKHIGDGPIAPTQPRHQVSIRGSERQDSIRSEWVPSTDQLQPITVDLSAMLDDVKGGLSHLRLRRQAQIAVETEGPPLTLHPVRAPVGVGHLADRLDVSLSVGGSEHHDLGRGHTSTRSRHAKRLAAAPILTSRTTRHMTAATVDHPGPTADSVTKHSE
jgi:hypothetical protein